VRVSRRWARSGRSRSIWMRARSMSRSGSSRASLSVSAKQASKAASASPLEDLGFGGDGEQLAGTDEPVVVGGTQVGGLAQQLGEALEPAAFGVGRFRLHREQGVVVDPGLAFRQRALQGGVGEGDRRRMPTVERREQVEQRPELPTLHPPVRGEVQHTLQPGGCGTDRVTQAGADLARVVGGAGLPRDPGGAGGHLMPRRAAGRGSGRVGGGGGGDRSWTYCTRYYVVLE
jgi:hypothetical protein